VDWAIAEGGPLASKEIDAIVAYMAAWEAAGAAPALPPLPPQPTATPTSAVDAAPSVAPSPAGTPAILAAPAGPDAELAALLGEDPIYAGAWIYSQNCYRCHLGYERARMGNAATLDVVRETVTQGKVTAGMPAFSFTRGGPLKRSEIDALLTYISAWEAQGAPPPLPQALAEAIASRLPAVTTVVTPTVTTPAVALAVAPLPAPGPTAPASAAPVAASASGVTWQVAAANGLRLAFYCLLGVPLLLLVLIGGLLASQIGYRGRQDV
jgi:mono/diheme cytochrome c family protein